ncbi:MULTISPECIES: zinc-dependent alcohol dehydrogenase family protein [Ramlibacter]|uniref:Zinc-dependent alcohol dehydrogenase family protein n=1 Tax=Ramlibacter aquaticus TaxID=2780094 RepID=A0ABR9SBB0_9BURK|nr:MULTISPECIES: zinc-dependent alcohol dehydrogenase family protein [Ramlibacter]MBE7939638.1 zinc-dependent alcohol dehydrogenase family protein [Ramlibacter aquaticus]
MRVMRADLARRTLCPEERPLPVPGPGELLLQVLACGVCRTDLHVIDGDLPPHRQGVVPGHEIVARVAGHGPGAGRFALGRRVGVPWLGRACGHCGFCGQGHENLCDEPEFTGYDRDGGFAEYTLADERFCFALPEAYDDLHAAPLLCAGLIGHRAWRLAGAATARRLGLYGFGAAAHLIAQVAVALGQEVYAFTRAGDLQGQAFARSLGASWAGTSDDLPPVPLDAALLFAPVGGLVPLALRAVRKGGTVVCAGIHMSPIPAFDYSLLWGERVLRSVANLTRADGEAFLAQVARTPVVTHVQPFALADAALAVQALREGRVQGAAVLVPGRAA